MKWLGRRESENVEDRRGFSGGGKLAVGGGIVGVIFLLLKLFLGGGENAQLLEQVENQIQSTQGQSAQTSVPLSEQDKEIGKFISVIFADCEEVWQEEFRKMNQEYTLPKLVLVSEDVQSACGPVGTSSGPCYCPADLKCYMDVSFFDDLKNKFGAEGGDFAMAYVIAHEVGHHIQNQLGISEKIRKLQKSKSEVDANKLSVAMELQADFLAGMWAKKAQDKFQMLEEGDIQEALSAAAAVGDDHIQKTFNGNVNIESFTHGTSKQRQYWFTKGFKTGDIEQGNTFEELNN